MNTPHQSSPDRQARISRFKSPCPNERQKPEKSVDSGETPGPSPCRRLELELETSLELDAAAGDGEVRADIARVAHHCQVASETATESR